MKIKLFDNFSKKEKDEIDSLEYSPKIHHGYILKCASCGCILKAFKDANGKYFFVGDHYYMSEEDKCDQFQDNRIIYEGSPIFNVMRMYTPTKKEKQIVGPEKGRSDKGGKKDKPKNVSINYHTVTGNPSISSAKRIAKYCKENRIDSYLADGSNFKDFIATDANIADFIKQSKKEIYFVCSSENFSPRLVPSRKGYYALVCPFKMDSSDTFVVIYVKMKDDDLQFEFEALVDGASEESRSRVFICCNNLEKLDIKIENCLQVYKAELSSENCYCSLSSDFRYRKGNL